MSAQKQVILSGSDPERGQETARARKVSVNTMEETLEESKKQRQGGERAESVLESYRRAFSGFSDEELMILDGIIPESKR